MIRTGKKDRTINLKDIVFYIINIPEDQGRKAFMQQQMLDLGLQYEFVPGIKVKPGGIGIALSHLKVLRQKELTLPFVVLEDDCQFFPERLHYQFRIPSDTDAVYFGHSLFGIGKKDQYGLQWGKAFASKYEIFNDEFIRIWGMLSRHAILYLSDKFHRNALKANEHALLNYEFPHPGDMAYARMQPDHLILAPHDPWCYQTEKHFGNHPATKRSIVDTILPSNNNDVVILKKQFPHYRKSFYLFKKNGTLHFQDNGGSSTRNLISMQMFKLADEQNHFEDFPLTFIYTDCYNDPDKVTEIREKTNQPNLPILSYNGTKELGFQNLIADSYFLRFPEIEVRSYDKYCIEIAAAGKENFHSGKIGWAGNPRNVSIDVKDLAPRNIFIDLAKNHPDKLVAHPVPFTNNALNCEGFLSLQEQIKKWKYLLDIEGYGYSGRIKFLLFSGRVVFIQDRPWHEWYFHQLEPFVHYIPVKRDLSDLLEKREWIESRPEKYEQIRQNALSFAQSELTSSKAIDRIAKVIQDLHQQ